MWVCRNCSGNDLMFEVGYYVEGDKFFRFCICQNAQEAAKVVNYLNGGNGYAPYMSLMDQLK